MPLDDPACSPADNALTCVRGQGEDAAVAVVDATGGVDEQPFPQADVAAQVGSDLLVAGRTADGHPWLTRTPVGNPDAPVWRHEPGLPLGQRLRFADAVVSQGVLTVSTPIAALDDPNMVASAFAVDVDTGRPW